MLSLYGRKGMTSSDFLHCLSTSLTVRKFSNMNTNLVLENDTPLTDLPTRRTDVMPVLGVESSDNKLLKWLKVHAEWSFPALSPQQLCDVYVTLQPNQTVSQRSVHFSVVGALLITFSIFRNPSSHLLLTKSHPSFKTRLTSPLIHISFLILPTGCDIYLR